MVTLVYSRDLWVTGKVNDYILTGFPFMLWLEQLPCVTKCDFNLLQKK